MLFVPRVARECAGRNKKKLFPTSEQVFRVQYVLISSRCCKLHEEWKTFDCERNQKFRQKLTHFLNIRLNVWKRWSQWKMKQNAASDKWDYAKEGEKKLVILDTMDSSSYLNSKVFILRRWNWF